MVSSAAYAVYVRMCQQHSVEIRREVVARTGGGSAAKTWTVAARGTLPARSVDCRRQALKSEEAIAAGVTSGKRTWRLFFYEDPKIDKRDRVFFTEGYAVEAEVVNPSYQHDSGEQMFECCVSEFGPAKS